MDGPDSHCVGEAVRAPQAPPTGVMHAGGYLLLLVGAAFAQQLRVHVQADGAQVTPAHGSGGGEGYPPVSNVVRDGWIALASA